MLLYCFLRKLDALKKAMFTVSKDVDDRRAKRSRGGEAAQRKVGDITSQERTSTCHAFSPPSRCCFEYRLSFLNKRRCCRSSIVMLTIHVLLVSDIVQGYRQYRRVLCRAARDNYSHDSSIPLFCVLLMENNKFLEGCETEL